MNKLMKIEIILIIVILIIILLLVFQNEYETMVNIKPIKNNKPIKWKRNPNCKYMMTETLRNVLSNNNFEETKDDDYVIYFPCTYNKIDNELKTASDNNNRDQDSRFFIIKNADQLTGKSYIWQNLVTKYGRDYAKTLMPLTYVLNNKYDKKILENEYDEDKIYILKKNIQRQQGLKITNKKDDILKDDEYIIAQELLQDSFLINKRKINMRIYLLIVCQNGEILAYAHRDGFMYYTKIPFQKGSLNPDCHITTGYIDRKVYEENPLTLQDFRDYLDNYERELTDKEVNIISANMKVSEYVFNNIYKLLNKVVKSVENNVCIGSSELSDNYTFQLFGVDVSLNNNLHPHIMEINKGPDLGAKDERDSNVKHGVVKDILSVLKITNDKHNFVKIYE